MSGHSSRADEWISLATGKYLDMVYRLAHARAGSRQDAEDVTQEVMLKLVNHAGEIESERHLKAWLIRVTVNQGNSLFRSAWKRLTAPMNEAVLANLPGPPPNDRLDEALSHLNPNLRIAIHLFYYEDMSINEIAETLHIRPAAVKVRLSRARKILRDELAGEGGVTDVPE